MTLGSRTSANVGAANIENSSNVDAKILFWSHEVSGG